MCFDRLAFELLVLAAILFARLDGNLKQQSSHDAVVKLLLPKELKEGVLAKFLATKVINHIDGQILMARYRLLSPR